MIPEQIVVLLAHTPTITQRVLAQRLGLSEDGVKYHLRKLKEAHRIERVGATKGGYWKVRNDT